MYHYTRKILGVMLNSFLFTKYTLLGTYLGMKESPSLLSAGLQMCLHNISIQWSDIRKLQIPLKHSVGVQKSEL